VWKLAIFPQSLNVEVVIEEVWGSMGKKSYIVIDKAEEDMDKLFFTDESR